LLSEILEQAHIWTDLERGLLSAMPDLSHLVKQIHSGAFDRIVLTGMGASFYSLYPANIALESAGIHTKMLETSELIYSFSHILTERTLLIVVSQSGYTAEVMQLLNMPARHNCFLLAITNNVDSLLAQASNIVMDLRCTIEIAPSTKTYTSTLLNLYMLISMIIGKESADIVSKIRNLTDVMRQQMPIWQSELDHICENLSACDHFLFLGRGSSIASAKGAALLFNEAVKIQAEGLEFGQYLHGPIEARSDSQCIVIFRSIEDHYLHYGLYQKLDKLGKQILLVGHIRFDHAMFFSIPIANEPQFLPLLEIIPVQLMAAKLAQLRNINPSEFSVASKVTTCESLRWELA